MHLLLPTLAIALGTAAAYSRYQRGTMLDVLGSDFLRTARAKGLRRRTAVLRHGLRTALVPMSTFFAYGFLALFTGAAFTEKVFGWHGMGAWFVDAVGKGDINSVVAVNVFAAVMVLLAGFLADVLHAALDPPAHCCRRYRCRTRCASADANGSCSPATRRAPPDRPPAAASADAARATRRCPPRTTPTGAAAANGRPRR